MATRVASPSLRGRFKLMLACAAAIALISWVGILVYRSSAPKENPVANAEKIDEGGEKPAEPVGAQKLLAGDVKNGNAKNSATDFTSRYGYKVALDDAEWTRWDDLPRIVPEAEFGALYKNFGRFLVIPVPLAALDPRAEALDHALLARLGIAYPSDQISNFREITIGDASGHRFEVRRELNGNPIEYRIVIVRHGSCAFLAAAWLDRAAAKTSESTDAANLALLDDALARFTFEPTVIPEPNAAAQNSAHRQALGNIYNDLGLSAYNARDFVAAIDSFRQAFQLQPNDPAILTNLINSHFELKQFREALTELDAHLQKFNNQPDLHAARAYLLVELGEADSAVREYKSLFSSGYFAEPPFTQYIALLAENGRADEALIAVNSLLRTRDSFTVRRLQAGLLRQRGEHEQAAQVLRQLGANRPFTAELAYDLADCLWACEAYEESLEVCAQLLAHRYDTAHTYLLQAKSQYGLQWYAEARKSLNAALKKEPANKDAQDLLAVVSAALGEGNNSAVQEAIEPVAGPPLAEPANDSSSAGSDNPNEHDGAYYVHRSLAISFIANKEFRQTERRVIRIRDGAGVVRFNTLQVAFDPVAERLFVNSLKVLDTAGKTLAVGKPSDYYIIDASRAGVATQGKILNIPVPGLQPDSTIELEFTRRGAVPPATFPYIRHFFSTALPVRSASLFVRADPGLVKFDASNGVRFERLDDGLLWTIDNPPQERNEPLPAPRSSFLPHVDLSSPNLNWKQLALDYLTSIEDRFAPNEAIDALAKQCTAGLQTDEDKTIAIVRDVQTKLTYNAIEFGRRARIPNRPVDIAQNKYGDCKDHALLLVQMLRAAGIPANLALANLDDAVDPASVSFDQFNHMLVYIPSFRGGRIIDCTDKDGDLATLSVPTDLAAAQVFILDAKNPRFVELPAYPEDSSRIEVDRTVRLSGDADAAVEERVTVTGYHAAFLRNMFKGVAVPERAGVLQRELAPLGIAMQVQSLEIDDLANRENPLVFRAVYLVRNRFRSADSVLLGELPALWERMYLDVTPSLNRRTPFRIEYPLDFVSRIRFAAPGYTVGMPEKPHLAGNTPFGVWSLEAQTAANGLQLDYKLHLPAGQHPASAYDAYDEAMETAVSGLSQNVVLERAK